MNKKLLYILSGATLLTLGASGCSKSFLEKEPSGLYTIPQLNEAQRWNPNIIRGYTSGLVSTTFAYGAGGISEHSDFGQKSVDIQTDLMSGDMVMTAASYGHFESAADLTGTKRDQNAYAYANWRYYYKLVFAANSIFDILGSDETLNADADNDQKLYFGQSKTMRGFAYFNLINLYATPYAADPNAKGIPMYRTTQTEGPSERSTVQQVYDQIIADLTAGKKALAEVKAMEQANNKDNVNEYVAQGYLAYAYLQSGQYQKAYDEAVGVINSGAYPLMTNRQLIESGFREWTNPEFMWAIDLTTDNTAALPTFWGHMDIFTYSYAAIGDYKVISSELQSTIPKEDVRSVWFNKSGIPYYKFWDSGRKEMGDRSWTNDEVYMRVAEMYLIAAESAFRSGNEANARKWIKELKKNRYNYQLEGVDEAEGTKKFVEAVDKLEGADLLNEILYNWRVELWGEGRSLLTMKRFKLNTTRDTRSGFLTGEKVNWDDPRLTFEAPSNEFTNNPAYK